MWRFGTPTLQRIGARRARAGKKKAPRSARSSTDDGAKRAPAKLNYDMDTLALCAKLKVPVPKDLSDVETLAQTVSEKKAGYQEKQKKALAGEGPEEEAEEAEAGPSNGKSGGGGGSAKGKKGGKGGGDANGVQTPVQVSIRCDEAFGSVLVELTAH